MAFVKLTWQPATGTPPVTYQIRYRITPNAVTPPAPPVTPPPPAVLVESAQATSVTTLSGQLVNSQLKAFTLVQSVASGLQIAVNGVIDPTTANVVLLLYYNHLVYQQNSAGNFYFKDLASDAWQPTTDPRVNTFGILLNDPTVTPVSLGLSVPFALAQLPDGSVLVTQRDKFVLTHIDTSGVQWDMAIPHNALSATEGGLLGICLDPLYVVNKTIYLTMTTSYTGAFTRYGNRVVQCQFNQATHSVSLGLTLAQWASGATGNGGTVKVGPDNCLYILTGCAGDAGQAQSLASLNGKILRLNTDGTIPLDNPFVNSPIWTIGHANPTGIAWQGAFCWAIEQGAAAGDVINQIVKGNNYGYPIASANAAVVDARGFLTIQPVLSSGPNEVWNPGGLVATPTALYWGALGTPAGASAPTGTPAVMRALRAGTALGRRNIFHANQFGRIRGMIGAQDGSLLFSTSNSDALGAQPAGSDYIYRVSPAP